MPPTPLDSGSSRPSADELNEQIRALWTGRGHPALPLTDEQREEYRRLLEALRNVERGDVVEAA